MDGTLSRRRVRDGTDGSRRVAPSCSTTKDGRYLDFLSGLAVTSLGHAHPAVAAAVSEQASKLLHVSNLFHTEHQAPLAAALDGLLGGGGRCFFVNSGAEANECAIKLARRYGQLHGGPERYHVISAYGSFHGRTLATLAATGQPQKQETFQPLPSGFRQVAFADLDALEGRDGRPRLRGAARGGAGRGRRAAGSGRLPARRAPPVRRARSAHDRRRGADRARAHRPLVRLRARRRVPDVVTLAKALGNGMPIGACWAAPRSPPRSGPATTPRRSAASRSRRARRSRCSPRCRPSTLPRWPAPPGARLTAALEALPAVTAVRGTGLLLAAELAPGYDAAEVARACLDSGVVVNAVTPTALRLAPSPLIVSDAEIDEAVAIIGRVLHAGCLARTGCPATGGAPMTRNFLDVDELDPARLTRILDQAAAGRDDPGSIAPVLAGLGVGGALREAVGAHPRRSRWRSLRSAGIRSSCTPTRCRSVCASRSPTSPARSRATAP